MGVTEQGRDVWRHIRAHQPIVKALRQRDRLTESEALHLETIDLIWNDKLKLTPSERRIAEREWQEYLEDFLKRCSARAVAA